MIFAWVTRRSEIEAKLKALELRGRKFIYIETEEDAQKHPAWESDQYLVFVKEGIDKNLLRSRGYDI